MKHVKVYTINTTEYLPGILGNHFEFSVYNENLTPVSGTNDHDLFVSCRSVTKTQYQIYRIGESGKEDRLVAIDPGLVDTIKFVAIDKVRKQLEDEKFRVEQLTKKLSLVESELIRKLELIDNTPIWKLAWNRWFK